MITLDVHTHSIASGHATKDTIADMAKQACQSGLLLLGITDHGPATPGAGKPSYFRSLAHAPRLRCGVELMYGAELNILNYEGAVDLDNDTLFLLDFSIASMHTQNITPGTKAQNTAAYIKAMENPYVNILGHCDDPKYPVDYHALVQAAKELHVLLEINNVSLSPNGYRGNSRPCCLELLSCCREEQQPIILSSDSHGAQNIGNVAYAQALVSEICFPENLILNYDIESFRAYIRRA